MGMNNGMPNAPVHDLVVQPKAKDLVVGTHGRSIYITDVTYVEQLTKELLDKDFNLFDLENITYNKNWGNKTYTWDDPETSALNVVYYSKNSYDTDIIVKTESGLVVKNMKVMPDKGLNFEKYDLTVDSTLVDGYKVYLKVDELKPADNGNIYLRPGKYTLEISSENSTESKTFEIKEKKNKERGEVLPSPGEFEEIK
jgi:hypothetical protein